jgi:hypothetical protein
MLPKRCFNEDLIALAIGMVACAKLRMNDVAPVGSENTYWSPRTGGREMAFVFAKCAGTTRGKSAYVNPAADQG